MSKGLTAGVKTVLDNLCLHVLACMGQMEATLVEEFRQSTLRMESLTVALDDGLVKSAQWLTDVIEKSALVPLALKVLIERESSRRLAAPEWTMPGLQQIPRRQAAVDDPTEQLKVVELFGTVDYDYTGVSDAT